MNSELMQKEKDAIEQPKSNDEHTAAYLMQKIMDAAHEAYDKLKDTVDFKNAIAEAEAIKQRIGIGEKKKITNGDLIRQMTDEELAEWLDLHGECNQCAYHPAQCKTECNEGHLKWLKQEVIEDGKS